jgi:hypothetical protein
LAASKPLFTAEDKQRYEGQILALQEYILVLERQNKEMQRLAHKAGTVRQAVLGLSASMPEPPTLIRSTSQQSNAEAIVLMATDWQWGETVDLHAMDQVNSYSVAIARRRAERFFKTALELSTTYWTGPPPQRLILVLGGDLISGEIHEELAKTNELLSLPALKDVVGSIIGGINLLLDKLGCPIDVIVIPGNHGRTTRRPEHKLYALTNYDNLAGDFIELYYQSSKRKLRPRFYTPASGDALVSLYGWNFLITHGDRMGSRGGTGFGGPIYTIARGFKRLTQDYAARKIQLDYIVCGHFHSSYKLDEGYASASLVGPSEFSRDWRMVPHPASQLFLSVHPKRGVTLARDIQVGHPSEGTIYRGPKDTTTRMPLDNIPRTDPRRMT